MLEALIVVISVAVDRITKLWSMHTLKAMPGGRMDFLPGVLELRYVENTGMAFSMFSNHTWILAVLSFVASVALGYYLLRYGHTQTLAVRLILALILGGAIGNLIDRVFYGYVVDFLNPVFVRFAVFNVADICLTCGLILLVFVLLLSPKARQGLLHEGKQR